MSDDRVIKSGRTTNSATEDGQDDDHGERGGELAGQYAHGLRQELGVERSVARTADQWRSAGVRCKDGCLYSVDEVDVIPQGRPAKRGSSHLVTRLLSLDLCKDRPSAIGNMTSALRHMSDGSVSVDVDMAITKTAQSFSKFDMTLIKCREAVTSNSCEYYQTWTYDLGVCQVMGASGMPWSASMRKMQPPFKCPFLKGDYQTRNATADLEALLHIPIQWEGNIWRCKIAVYNELRALHLCWIADLEFPRVKNHQRRNI